MWAVALLALGATEAEHAAAIARAASAGPVPPGYLDHCEWWCNKWTGEESRCVSCPAGYYLPASPPPPPMRPPPPSRPYRNHTQPTFVCAEPRFCSESISTPAVGAPLRFGNGAKGTLLADGKPFRIKGINYFGMEGNYQHAPYGLEVRAARARVVLVPTRARARAPTLAVAIALALHRHPHPHSPITQVHSLHWYFRFLSVHRFNTVRFFINNDAVLRNEVVPRSITWLGDTDRHHVEHSPYLAGLTYVQMLKRVCDDMGKHGLLTVVAAHRLRPQDWPGAKDSGLWYNEHVPLEAVKQCALALHRRAATAPQRTSTQLNSTTQLKRPETGRRHGQATQSTARRPAAVDHNT